MAIFFGLVTLTVAIVYIDNKFLLFRSLRLKRTFIYEQNLFSHHALLKNIVKHAVVNVYAMIMSYCSPYYITTYS